MVLIFIHANFDWSCSIETNDYLFPGCTSPVLQNISSQLVQITVAKPETRLEAHAIFLILFHMLIKSFWSRRTLLVIKSTQLETFSKKSIFWRYLTFSIVFSQNELKRLVSLWCTSCFWPQIWRFGQKTFTNALSICPNNIQTPVLLGHTKISTHLHFRLMETNWSAPSEKHFNSPYWYKSGAFFSRFGLPSLSTCLSATLFRFL